MLTQYLSGLVALAVLAAPSAGSLKEAAAGHDKPEPDFPPFKEVTKDMKAKEGFFTLYHDEKKDKLFARIPRKMLKKNFLLATSIARGPFFAGWQWSDGAVYWDRLGKKLVLMLADPRYAKGKGSTVEDVIARTYTDTIIKAVPIVTEINGDAVIDLADLLKTDVMDVGRLFNGRLNGELSRYGSIKNFEMNTEISVDAAMMGKEGSGGQPSTGRIVRLHYSFSKLPENNYKPRLADSRIGYFLVAIKDWTTAHGERTVFKRYVSRWQLRKAEPEKEVSDVVPEDQIVFYIEKTVPVKYRPYVREGILEWNKAFSAAGLRNALVVRQQTRTNEYKDLDPEDIRYNFLRWIVTGIPFAMGPSRVNPFTGQILDADIIFDDSMVRYIIHDYEVRGPRPEAGYTDGPMEEFLAHHPAWDRLGTASAAVLAPPHLRLERWGGRRSPPAIMSLCGTRPQHRRDSRCELGAGMARQLAFAALVAAKQGAGELTEEFIGQAIKETVMHEVGHTLGLRHNFKASSWLKLSDIKNCRAQGGQPTTASVMDYNPYTYAGSVSDQGSFATPTIGPYDYWAIEYGYRHFMPGGGKGSGSQDDAVPTTGEEPRLGKGGSGGSGPDAADGRSVADADAEARKDQPTDTGADTGGDPQDDPQGPSAGPKNEAEMLAAIARRCAEPGLAYATDEDTSFFFPDPTVNRWDNGSDPLTYASDGMTAIEELWKDGMDWAVKDTESYHQARRAFGRLLGNYGYLGMVAARFVGGQYINRGHKGDPCSADGGPCRPPIRVVDAAKQREALKVLADQALSDTAFRFSPALLKSLGPGRWRHWDSDAYDRDVSYDIHQRVLALQARVLLLLLNPFTINRVHDSEMLVPADEDAFTVPELFGSVAKIVWSELDAVPADRPIYTNRRPMVSSFRRALQRRHVQMLIDMVLSEPGSMIYPDAHAVARLTLKDLAVSIGKALHEHESRMDEFTRAHLGDARQRITMALDAEFSVNQARAG